MFQYSYVILGLVNQVLLSETVKQNDRQDDEEQLKIHDVRGECFAPHLALMLKSECHKFMFISIFFPQPREIEWCEARSCTSPIRGALRVKSEVSTFHATSAISMKVLVRVS